MSAHDEVLAAARALAGEGLVDAFGHVSARVDAEHAVITPPRPLASVRDPASLAVLPLGELDALPAGVPKEAWIHWAIYRSRPDAGGICRAQPSAPLALAAAGRPILALHGQAALVAAEVPVVDDSRLVRERGSGEAVARVIGSAGAVVLRGNGAVTVGTGVGTAAARMRLLEDAAQVNLAALAAGDPVPLPPAELAAWEAAAPELLGRLWAHLQDRHATPAA